MSEDSRIAYLEEEVAVLLVRIVELENRFDRLDRVVIS